jgi:hypothetical protein
MARLCQWLGQGFGRGTVGQRGQQGADELGVLRGFEPALGFERVAQAHQFFDAGDDAGLFGEGWQCAIFNALASAVGAVEAGLGAVVGALVLQAGACGCAAGRHRVELANARQVVKFFFGMERSDQQNLGLPGSPFGGRHHLGVDVAPQLGLGGVSGFTWAKLALPTSDLACGSRLASCRARRRVLRTSACGAPARW